MKSFSIAVIIYMFLGITWWGILLFRINSKYYELGSKQYVPGTSQYDDWIEDRNRQSMMIIGEGVVLVFSLLAGIWIIYRSGQKEIEAINLQKNFLLSVSHELKSPIASIKLALQTLLKHRLSEEEIKELVSRAVSDSDRLEHLVQNILISVKIDSKEMQLIRESIQLNSFLKDLIDKYHDNDSDVVIIKKIDLTKDLTIEGDKLALDLAVSNIIDNAIKYSNKEGKVVIRTIHDEDIVKITVKDEGIGVRPHEKTRIFGRFYRGTGQEVQTRKGTGLGLYLSRQIILAHHGKLELVSNEEDSGSIFQIKLPFRAGK